MITSTTINPLEATIDLSKLSFADWIAIAKSWNSDEKWAFYRWRDTGGIPPQLPLEKWEEIAQVIGWSGNWAYRQFKENSGSVA